MGDFEVGRIIGVGSFGYVRAATQLDTQEAVVIKAVSKATCIKNGQVRHLVDEKELLVKLTATMDHPFLVNLRGSFQDTQNVYLIMDYVAGGDLFCYLRSYPAKHGHK
jgi:serine/threonine protein kinase